MSLQSRIDSLKDRHRVLEVRILDEDHRPQPNPDALMRLKGEKLRLKDEMERLSNQGRGRCNDPPFGNGEESARPDG